MAAALRLPVGLLVAMAEVMVVGMVAVTAVGTASSASRNERRFRRLCQSTERLILQKAIKIHHRKRASLPGRM